jgi:hypothetical protein
LVCDVGRRRQLRTLWDRLELLPHKLRNECRPISSLYLDGEDRFHIAYYDAINHTLKYAVEVD